MDLPDLEKQVEAAIAHGEKTYNDTEGNLDHALRATLQYYTEILLESVNEIKAVNYKLKAYTAKPSDEPRRVKDDL